jgi:hypothetical membrane protein
MNFRELVKRFRSWPLSAQLITIIIPVFTTLVIISIILFGPTFSFVGDHMSTLGSQGANPRGFIYFDVACIITGILLFPYFYGLRRWRTDNRLLNASLYVIIGIGFIACFGIIMQAIYRADFSIEHFYYSAIHWVGDALLLMVAPIALLLHKKFYRPIIIVGLIATGFNLYYVLTWGHDAWIEWITAITTLLFAALIGANMINKEIK